LPNRHGKVLISVGSNGEQPLEVTGKVRCKSGAVPQLWRNESLFLSQNAHRQITFRWFICEVRMGVQTLLPKFRRLKQILEKLRYQS